MAIGRDRAVVCGASMAGLLAARVLWQANRLNDFALAPTTGNLRRA